MNWQPKYKASGKLVNRLLTDEEKVQWQKHPATKDLFTYVETKEPKKQNPEELKLFIPKDKTSSNDRKRNIGGSGEPHK